MYKTINIPILLHDSITERKDKTGISIVKLLEFAWSQYEINNIIKKEQQK